MTQDFSRLLEGEPELRGIVARRREQEASYRANLAELAQDPVLRMQVPRYRAEFQELRAFSEELNRKYAGEIQAYRANPRAYILRAEREGAAQGKVMLNDGNVAILMERADAYRFIQIDRSLTAHRNAIIDRLRVRLDGMGVTDPHEVQRYVDDFREEHVMAPTPQRHRRRALDRQPEAQPPEEAPCHPPRETPSTSKQDVLVIAPPLPTPVLRAGTVREV